MLESRICNHYTKKTSPESLTDLRNISCTLLTSKVYESYVLDWLKSEVALRSNQYGDVKGLGTDHLLVGLWQQVLENAEDYRTGTVITSIDYSEAFNRMGYQECLTSLARNGASTPVLELIATFLTDRLMTVKVGQILFTPKKVNGGCPQGQFWMFSCLTRPLTTLRKTVRNSKTLAWPLGEGSTHFRPPRAAVRVTRHRSRTARL